VPTEYSYASADPPGSRGHLLDLYLPAGAPRGVVVWSTGSAWLSDDGKAGAVEIASAFPAAGWAVAGVSVRSSGQTTFPGQVHDIKAALRWLANRAGEFGFDPARLVIAGNSSGGWVASMAALTAGRDELEGTVGERGTYAVAAAIDFYGPSDFVQMDDHMPPGAVDEFNAIVNTTNGHADERSPESLLLGARIHDVADRVAAANPATYARADAPPMLIIHGQADPLVPHHQSVVLYEALKAAGADATFVSIPGNRHEHPYVVDESASRGRVVETTRPERGSVTVLRNHGPTWTAILAWLDDVV
jgi:acetyl esterase/lipase